LNRAATLCKADLVTGMVGEFPELQGVMGREYALASGEKREVADAIFEHYLPRGASDSLPSTDAGAILGLADRFDTLCGIFGIGKPPTGAADPFALRRACLAIINVILAKGFRVSLQATVKKSFLLLQPKIQQAKVKASDVPVETQVMEFFRGRLKALWTENHRTDVVEAVLSVGYDDLVSADKRLLALGKIVGQPDFVPLAVAFKRVVNIVEKQGKDVSFGAVDVGLLQDSAEKALHQAYLEAQKEVDQRIRADDFAGALKSIVSLKPTVDTFFDKVMVMVEDKPLRENRVRLLTVIGKLFGNIADFSKIQVET
jgi:glycyl-tRNA synthetase beta chain